MNIQVESLHFKTPKFYNMNKEIEGVFVLLQFLYSAPDENSFKNLAPDENLLIRSKYRAPLFNREVRNYNQIRFIFGTIN